MFYELHVLVEYHFDSHMHFAAIVMREGKSNPPLHNVFPFAGGVIKNASFITGEGHFMYHKR